MITEIVSPKKIVFSEDVDFIILPGEEGDFGILDKHSPIISSLRLGLIYIYKDQRLIRSFFIRSGICEITDNKCIILTEKAEDSEKIDSNIPNNIKKDSEISEYYIVKKKVLENKYYN
ncbi:ATP synthase F1 subunit epsilon [Rickettsiales bacterium]|nr:ATP synthase F1 subunit epsilon [Rickettsiales bacterium]